MGEKDNLYRLYELLDNEIHKIVEKNNLTPSELDNAMKAVCLMEKIEELGYGEGYSETSYYGRSRDSHYSGERGRSPVTGRYVSRDGRSMRGMSGHSIKDRMISRLEQMMDETNSEYERNEISGYIHSLEMNK